MRSRGRLDFNADVLRGALEFAKTFWGIVTLLLAIGTQALGWRLPSLDDSPVILKVVLTSAFVLVFYAEGAYRARQHRSVGFVGDAGGPGDDRPLVTFAPTPDGTEVTTQGGAVAKMMNDPATTKENEDD